MRLLGYRIDGAVLTQRIGRGLIPEPGTHYMRRLGWPARVEAAADEVHSVTAAGRSEDAEAAHDDAMRLTRGSQRARGP